MLTWSERRVLPGVVRVWERACVSPTRGTVMNRGCVFASRDLARCGPLQRCGQAAAAAAAAETASQEPPPASPTSRCCGGTPGESLQTSSGRGEDAGVTSGAGGGLAPSRCRACCCHLSRRAARRSWWARAPGEGTWPSRGTWLSLQAQKARERRGSVRSHSCSRLLPPAGSRWHHYSPPHPPPRGGSSRDPAAEPSSGGRFSTQPLKLFAKLLEGQDARRSGGHVFLPTTASRCSFAVEIFPGGGSIR
ncbi:unnamed protein product [Nyctereutes procyonoides]|uniref:(raccoon dog) hypothetical protein n=1 Tax=Nyctereutes procyonoides TaxID=34880 RepID=A0A812A0I5_NYCPR|nr:unnamed protein product [Nyctereutes procyonoides]